MGFWKLVAWGIWPREISAFAEIDYSRLVTIYYIYSAVGAEHISDPKNRIGKSETPKSDINVTFWGFRFTYAVFGDLRYVLGAQEAWATFGRRNPTGPSARVKVWERAKSALLRALFCAWCGAAPGGLGPSGAQTLDTVKVETWATLDQVLKSAFKRHFLHNLSAGVVGQLQEAGRLRRRSGQIRSILTNLVKNRSKVRNWSGFRTLF